MTFEELLRMNDQSEKAFDLSERLLRQAKKIESFRNNAANNYDDLYRKVQEVAENTKYEVCTEYCEKLLSEAIYNVAQQFELQLRLEAHKNRGIAETLKDKIQTIMEKTNE